MENLDLGEEQSARSLLSSNYWISGITQLAFASAFGGISSATDLFLCTPNVSTEIIGIVITIAISDKAAKERVKKFLVQLLNIKIGLYHAANNDCRHYV